MAIGKKTGGRDWKPGESGNPNGRPPDEKTFTGALTETVDKQVLAQKLWDLAKDGNISAIKYIYDRKEGRPTQSMDIASNIVFPEVVGLYPDDYRTPEDTDTNRKSS